MLTTKKLKFSCFSVIIKHKITAVCLNARYLFSRWVCGWTKASIPALKCESHLNNITLSLCSSESRSAARVCPPPQLAATRLASFS